MTEKHDIYYLQVKRLQKWETLSKDKALEPVTEGLGRALEDRPGSIRIVAGTRKVDGGYDWATLFFKSADIPLDTLTQIDPPPDSVLGKEATPSLDQDPSLSGAGIASPENDLERGAVGGAEPLAGPLAPLRANKNGEDDEKSAPDPSTPSPSKPSPSTPGLSRERIFEAHPPQPLPYQTRKRRSRILPFLLAVPLTALFLSVVGIVYLGQAEGPPPRFLQAVLPSEALNTARNVGRDLIGLAGGSPSTEEQASETPAADTTQATGTSSADLVLTTEEVVQLATTISNGTQPTSILQDRFQNRRVRLTATTGDTTSAGDESLVTIGGLFVCPVAGPVPEGLVEVVGQFERTFGGRVWLSDCTINSAQ